MKRQMNIPDYVNCKTNKDFCEWYIHQDCKETCDYSLYLEGVLGIGSLDEHLAKKLMGEFKIKEVKE